MAGRCLGELVRKMGERVLTHIIPILQKGMSSEDADTRQASTFEGVRKVSCRKNREIWANSHCAAFVSWVYIASRSWDSAA